jgi:hypothetical protein
LKSPRPIKDVGGRKCRRPDSYNLGSAESPTSDSFSVRLKSSLSDGVASPPCSPQVESAHRPAQQSKTEEKRILVIKYERKEQSPLSFGVFSRCIVYHKQEDCLCNDPPPPRQIGLNFDPFLSKNSAEAGVNLNTVTHSLPEPFYL